jgi:hypothetical protein
MEGHWLWSTWINSNAFLIKLFHNHVIIQRGKYVNKFVNVSQILRLLKSVGHFTWTYSTHVLFYDLCLTIFEALAYRINKLIL